MKPTKQKHGKENIIGKIIYAFLMFIPLLAIGVTCAYAIFNKNAYQSYGDKYIENLTQITNANDFIENSDYKVVYNENLTNAGNQIYDVNSTSLNDYLSLQESQYVTRITFLNDNGTPRIQYVLNDNTTDRIMNWQNVCPTFVINLQAHNNNYVNTNFTSLYMITETTRNISDVFYYSIDKVQESPLFNWSSNTATYSVLQTTCTTLGITTQFIPMLLSYWLMMSLMYLLYDIALLIVHMAHNRIHDIESSM